MDVSAIHKQFNREKLVQEKESLETRLSTAHQTNEDIGQLSADLAYYSTLLDLYNRYEKQVDIFNQATELLNSETDPEFLEMAQKDLETSETEAEKLSKEMRTMKTERDFTDPDDNKSVIIEVRAGTGGEEASLFAADLFRMYSNFAKKKGWQVEVVDSSVSENGGYKEVTANIKGRNVYKNMKYESGVHRVQRIPATETAGRIHTSTASVAILPEVKEVEVKIDPADLKIDVMRASGPGGQSVNTTDSAVRITHLPSGIVVSCRETKYQDQNKVKAMNLLRAKLYEKQKEEQDAKRAGMRSSQIGSAKRAEKIRTYNFPQSRITDHRVKKSWFDIETVISGEIDEMVNDINTEMINMMMEKQDK